MSEEIRENEEMDATSVEIESDVDDPEHRPKYRKAL